MHYNANAQTFSLFKSVAVTIHTLRLHEHPDYGMYLNLLDPTYRQTQVALLLDACNAIERTMSDKNAHEKILAACAFAVETATQISKRKSHTLTPLAEGYNSRIGSSNSFDTLVKEQRKQYFLIASQVDKVIHDILLSYTQSMSNVPIGFESLDVMAEALSYSLTAKFLVDLWENENLPLEAEEDIMPVPDHILSFAKKAGFVTHDDGFELKLTLIGRKLAGRISTRCCNSKDHIPESVKPMRKEDTVKYAGDILKRDENKEELQLVYKLAQYNIEDRFGEDIEALDSLGLENRELLIRLGLVVPNVFVGSVSSEYDIVLSKKGRDVYQRELMGYSSRPSIGKGV